MTGEEGELPFPCVMGEPDFCWPERGELPFLAAALLALAFIAWLKQVERKHLAMYARAKAAGRRQQELLRQARERKP